MRKGTEIESLRSLVLTLEKASKKNAAIWGRCAFYLRKPSRQRAEINLNRLNRVSKEGDVLLVPGKVLGIGKISKKIKVAALRFSESASQKLKTAGVEMTGIEQLLEANPKGSKVRLVI